MALTLTTIDGFAIILIIILVTPLVSTKRRNPLPPGPRGLPWIGSAFSWPVYKPWETYSRWGRQYGPIVFLTMLGKPIVVLNSAEAAFELLDRRGAKYSDRPIRPLVKWAGLDKVIGMSQYGPRVQNMRRMVKDVGGKVGVARNISVISQERHRFLRRLLENPANAVRHIRMSTASTIIDLNYGYDVCDANDPLIQLLTTGMRAVLQLVVIRANICELFPKARWVLPNFIPGAYLYKAAVDAKEYINNVNLKPFAYVKQQLAAGKARSSFISERLNEPDLTPEKEELIRYTSTSIFGAGFETTAISVYYALLAIMLFPDIQAKAQAELDAVVGSDRLPTWEDQAQLPYTAAVVKEILRWAPPAAEGVPHRVNEDDVYMGYRIPKDSTIIVNIFGICHDPAEYTIPNAFNPDRFLGESPERDPRELVFGFGRRICPGQPLAEASIFLHMAALLSVFNISRAKDAPPINPLDRTQIPRYPEPITHCVVMPRSEAARGLVKSVEYRGE